MRPPGQRDTEVPTKEQMPIHLHAALIEGAPALWASADVSRKASTATTPAFGVDAKKLRDVVSRLDLAEFAAPLTVTAATAWLPTRAGAVVAPQADAAKARLHPWRVRVAVMTGPQAVAFFSAVLGREVIADDTHIGPDVSALGRVLRLAFELVAGQQFLPAVQAVAHEPLARAVWQPLLGAAERRACDDVASGLPAVIGAFSLDTAARAPDYDPRRALDTALTFFVDAIVRGAQTEPRRPAARAASLQARWLAALHAPDSTFAATSAEYAELSGAIAAWQRPVREEREAAYRLCLRVEEPGTDADTAPARDEAERWHVAYLLQSRIDPSLLIDAAEAMRSAALRREYLTTLGRAAPFSRWIDESLARDAGAPAGFALDTAAAFAFLQTDAPQCAAADIGVILPSWWLGMDAKARIGVRAAMKRPKFTGANALHAGSLLEVDWTIALGDETLTARELARLARLKTPLVRIRGRWIHVDPAELKAALAHVAKTKRRTLTVAEALRIAVGAPVNGIPAGTTLAATGSVAEHLSRLRGETRLEPIAPPAGLQATLRPYQSRGYAWLNFLTRSGFGACLADDMGLGKTIQTLALITRDWEAKAAAPVLLVCPTSVIGNWQREAERFAPGLPVHVHHGADRARGAAFTKSAQRAALVLTGYALLHRDRALFERVEWRGMVLDEAQNVKNPDSAQARAARSIAAGYRVALTGTPVENHVGDMWSLMEFLNPGMLGTLTEFRREFFVPIQVQGNPQATERLRSITGPFVLRRLKSDASIISDLPAKQEYTVTCTLTREQATLYAAVLRDFDKDLDATDGMKRRGMILATLSKLKQICNHPAQFAGDNSALPGRSGKLARLEEMLEEVLDVGEAALVFTQFAEMGELIRRRLEQRFGHEVPFLHGGVAKTARDTMVEDFSGGTGPAVFILSLKAGGSGLNLTRANHVFHFDRWWNPAVENQATDRAFRIGQTKAVQVHKFVCGGTLEEKIALLIARKAAISERVVGSGEGWLTELSSSQLRELVALSAEAVAE